MIEWARPYPVWLYAIAAVALVVSALAARRWSISERLRSWLLFAPRFVVLGGLLLILIDPVRRNEFQLPARPAQVIGLVDASRSMGLDEPLNRLDRVKQAIEQAESAPRSAEQARMSLYRFGASLAAAPDLASIRAADEASRLSEALERLPSRFSRDPPRAIVVFSDGAADDRERLDEAAAGYRRLGIPVHVLPVGERRAVGDVAIQDLVVPARVPLQTKATIRGVLRSDGYDGRRVELRVRSAVSPQAPPVAVLPLTLASGEQPFELVVEANADTTELVIEAPPLENEVTERNNRVPFRLGARPRKLRVLYMEGTAGTEYRWIRDALQEDPEIECTAMLADQQYVQRPRLQRVDDPYRGFPATREELLSYDVVICSDISRGAFTKEQLDWTVELVSQRGGGFVMVGGITSFGAGGWDQTAWDKLIPVDMTGGTLGQGWLYHQFRVTVPPEAEQHPIWRIVPDRAENRRVLDAMPPFRGTNYIQRLKPAATLLGVSATPIPNVGVMPIFAAESYGRGRTFAFAPDSTADWGLYFESQWGEGDNRYFRRFWRNVVRWLAENSLNGQRRLAVDTDRRIYRPGQPIEIQALAFDEQLTETTAYQLTARLVRPAPPNSAPGGTSAAPGGTPPSGPLGDAAGSVATTPLTPAAGGRGYAGVLEATEQVDDQGLTRDDAQGVIEREVEVTATDGGRTIATARTAVRLLADSPELRRPRADPEPLERLATATDGGVLASGADLRRLLQNLEPTRGEVIVTRSPLWDRGPFWLALVALLCAEWALRRRAGFG